MQFWTPIWPNLAPTLPQLGPQHPFKIGLKTMLKCNFLKSWFLQPLQYEMLVFASPRGSKNDQKCIQKQLVILVLFQLQKNTLPASILLQLGSILGPPRRPQGASKASWKSLLEASWAILAANSIFGLPGGTPGLNFLRFLINFWWFLKLFLSKNDFGFSASQRHNRVPWIALLSFFLLVWGCFCRHWFGLALSLDLQVLNVTIVFHGLVFSGCFCISCLYNCPLPRRSGRSPLESAAA